jgi:hypothetical protein
MRHSPGLLEDTSGVRVEPTLELGDRDQAKTATADKPQLGLDVGLERVEADAERLGSFAPGEGQPQARAVTGLTKGATVTVPWFDSCAAPLGQIRHGCRAGA